jgi:peroxidase
MFGQFIDHDITLAASTADPFSNSVLQCQCQSNNRDCVNIPTPDDIDQACMTLTRSGASFQKFDCELNAREQLNLMSSYLDLGQIYDNDESNTRQLRTFSNGLLQTRDVPGFDTSFLPFANRGTCVEESNNQLCFKSGDIRTSQTMLLVGVHTLFMREHNRIADILQRLNPTWSDESVFQETRRILNAQYQNMIYGEW